MVPRLVPEISSLDAFCDTGAAGGAAGIGDSRSWMTCKTNKHHSPETEAYWGKYQSILEFEKTLIL